MSTTTEAMNEVDAEIEARKLRLRTLKEEHARRAGVAHPDKAPLGRDALDSAMPDGMGASSRKEAAARATASPGQRKVLDAAARLYKPGEAASRSRIADEAGLTPQRVSVTICELKKKRLWPYKGQGGEKPARAAESPALRARINGEPPPAQSTWTKQEPRTRKSDLSEPARIIHEPIQAPDADPEPPAGWEAAVVDRLLDRLDRGVLEYLAGEEVVRASE